MWVGSIHDGKQRNAFATCSQGMTGIFACKKCSDIMTSTCSGRSIGRMAIIFNIVSYPDQRLDFKSIHSDPAPQAVAGSLTLPQPVGFFGLKCMNLP
jgi:hypothetical protein